MEMVSGGWFFTGDDVTQQDQQIAYGPIWLLLVNILAYQRRLELGY